MSFACMECAVKHIANAKTFLMEAIQFGAKVPHKYVQIIDKIRDDLVEESGGLHSCSESGCEIPIQTVNYNKYLSNTKLTKLEVSKMAEKFGNPNSLSKFEETGVIYSFAMMGKAADLGISLLDKKFGGDKKPLYKRLYVYAIMITSLMLFVLAETALKNNEKLRIGMKVASAVLVVQIVDAIWEEFAPKFKEEVELKKIPQFVPVEPEERASRVIPQKRETEGGETSKPKEILEEVSGIIRV